MCIRDRVYVDGVMQEPGSCMTPSTYTSMLLAAVGVTVIVNCVDDPSPVKMSLVIDEAAASVRSAVYVEPSNDTSYLPNGISFTGKSVYISGGRYTGTIGLQNLSTSTGNTEFSTNTIRNVVTNADMTFETQGTGVFDFNTTTALVVPTGTTAQRPSAQEGIIRFNTTTGKYEVSLDGSTYTCLLYTSPSPRDS